MNERPLPTPDPATLPYWEAARRHNLSLPCCTACGHWHFYPRTLCPSCGSPDIAWRESAGKGHIFSFTIVERAPSPAFQSEVPYALGIIALDEGPHLMATIVGGKIEDIRIGDRVAVRYVDIDDVISLPVFERLAPI